MFKGILVVNSIQKKGNAYLFSGDVISNGALDNTLSAFNIIQAEETDKHITIKRYSRSKLPWANVSDLDIMDLNEFCHFAQVCISFSAEFKFTPKTPQEHFLTTQLKKLPCISYKQVPQYKSSIA